MSRAAAPFFAVYVVIGAICTIAVLVVALVVYSLLKNKYGDRACRCCCCAKEAPPEEQTTTVSRVVPIQSASTTRQAAPAHNYMVLEDHLHLVDSDPDLTTRARRNSRAPARPVTAATMIRRAKTAMAREKNSVTLEFLPHDSTLLQIEGYGNKIRKITKMAIVIEDKIRQTKHYTMHRGTRDDDPVCVFKFALSEATYEAAKREIVYKDQMEVEAKSRLTPHPRFVRYLGTCFNPNKLEAYVITDYVVGCTLEEMIKNPEIRSAMEMTEESKVQAAADLADAVYFLHGHSTPVAHGGITLGSVIVDGETHRGKLVAKEATDRISQLTEFKEKEDDVFSNIAENEVKFSHERSPEEISEGSPAVPVKSDIWSLGATILQSLFDQPVWDLYSLTKQFNVRNPNTAVSMAVQLKFEPSIIMTVRTANAKLQFLSDCLKYKPEDRPAATYVTRGLQQCVLEIKRESRTPASQISSFLFPGRRVINSSKTRRQMLDPLVKQQIEWNVKQDAGFKKRAVMVGIRNYLGRDYKSLSVTPVNDVKDVTSMLLAGGFGMSNVYENVKSKHHFEDLLKAYVAAVNKEPETIELLVFYYAGLGVQGLPRKLARRRRLGIFLDRVGISHDLALVTSNESLFPVAKLQTILAELNAKVKRKVLILDIRVAKQKLKKLPSFSIASDDNMSAGDDGDDLIGVKGLDDENSLEGGPNAFPQQEEKAATDWEVPTISEEALDKLTTMFTIYPTVEPIVSHVACDSHPSRTNGFLTGCLINVLKDYNRPTIEELPSILNLEMDAEKDKNQAFTGIECKADYIPVGHNIWMVPFLTKN